MQIDSSWILSLLEKYHDELVALAPRVRERYWIMCRRAQGAAFSDFEGEVLYCLLRELKPGVFYEISPDCGYSTLYAAEALKRNGAGMHYAFELASTKGGRSTEEVVRENVGSALVPQQLRLILGDATETVGSHPDPDVILIDSCHDSWFAKWYWSELLPRVADVAIVQDVLFHDRAEPSGEAEWLLTELTRSKVPFLSLGVLERTPEATALRRDFVPRRPYETNSILIGGVGVQVAPLSPRLGTEVDEPVTRLEARLAQPPRRATAHRELAGLARHFAHTGDTWMSDHYWARAVAFALDETRRAQGKALAELIVQAIQDRRPARALAVAAVAALYCRPALKRGFRGVAQLASARAKRLLLLRPD